MATRDGFYLQNDTGILQCGLKCAGGINPPTNISNKRVPLYDVIVIGAGYSDMMQGTDVLRSSGFNVLLLEGRDRIGGRTYTAEVDGHLYEMGGTWVHWNQPHTYREMTRYGLTSLLTSHDKTVGVNHYTTYLDGKRQDISHEKAHSMTEKAFRLLCDVDGRLGREVMPYPHDPHFNPKVKQWEEISVAQRLDQIRPDLTDDEATILQARLSSIYGTDMDKAGLFEVLRWWALGGYTTDSLYETGDEFKIPTGQSSFARCFFGEALRTEHLSYSFNTAVKTIEDKGDQVLVNQTWEAKRLICTVPLNVLEHIRFESALSPTKTVAMRLRNINHGAKFHFEVWGTALRSWASTCFPVTRSCSAFGDGLTPRGNTHVVSFGSNKRFSTPEKDARSYIADCKKLHDMDVEKTIWHNWSTDPFSQGSWCMFPPGFNFDDLAALRNLEGNILFANSDWALGWRGFIDGAIERGGLAAKKILDDICPSNVVPKI
ncbi:hypothetical protein FSARC_8771 [Fusarium sarcochroum]|uniref:Amine oxidase n=1 Tax=Fusarium sarcochroum TaxID=1208366 RepID=A0A8H4TS89_9HYPO|nr:hypothetical protein FSARC_8771 [Fusarium sarcochroum]